jgi:molybdenum cofactor biosynthesis enzyme MoaA
MFTNDSGVAVFITERCNLKCAYCKTKITCKEMSESTFDNIVKT